MKNKQNLSDLISRFLFLTIFILYYCFNDKLFLGFNLYIFPIILLTIIMIFKLKKNKIYKDNIKHFLWYLMFFAFACISLIWSINKDYSITVLKRIAVTLIFILDLSIYIDTKEKIEKIIKYNIFGLIVMIIILMINYSNKPYFYGDIVGLHRNTIAISLVFGVVQLYYLFKENNNKKLLILIPLFLFALYRTGSRKSLVFIFLFFIFELFISQGKNIKKILKNGTIIIFIVITSFLVIKSNEVLMNRMADMFMSFWGTKVEDASVIEREYYRELAFEIFKDNPIIGNGIFGFAAYLNNIGYSHVAYCHCNWLELLSTLGILGFVIYYSQYYIILKGSIKNFDHNNINITIPLLITIILIITEYGLVSYYDISIQFMIFINYKLLQFNLTNNKIKLN